MHEQDNALIDHALSSKVVLCSPVSLFAILVVIRQAVDNFAVEQSSNQIISELGVFNKQWLMFVDRMELLSKRIESAQKEYTTLVNTRKRALERPLNRIESIRQQRGLPLADDAGIDDLSLMDEAVPELAEVEGDSE